MGVIRPLFVVGPSAISRCWADDDSRTSARCSVLVGLHVHPRGRKTSAPSASAGPSQPDPTDFRGYFDIESDTPAFKVPRLPPPRTYVTEMFATRTNVILRQTSHGASMAQEHRPLSQSSVTSHTRSRLSTVYPRDGRLHTLV